MTLPQASIYKSSSFSEVNERLSLDDKKKKCSSTLAINKLIDPLIWFSL